MHGSAGVSPGEDGTGDSAAVLANRLGGRRAAPGYPPRPRGGPLPWFFLTTVGVLIAGLIGIIAWGASDPEPSTGPVVTDVAPLLLPVRGPDGTLRQEAALAAAAKPAPPPVDPVEAPVTLAPSRHPPLVEDTPQGPLPRRGEDGTEPWRFYARPFPADDKRPRIALVLTEAGTLTDSFANALEALPPAVTLALPANLPGLQTAVDRARMDGHEVWLDIPMQPQGYPRTQDPGPGTLLVARSETENIRRLEIWLARATGYVGVTSSTGSRFLQDARRTRPVLAQAADRGLAFVDGVPGTDGKVVTQLAAALPLPFATRDIQIDATESPAAIDAALAELERLALENGRAVGFGRSTLPATVERVASWAEGLTARGVVLAPASAVIRTGNAPGG